MIPEITESNIDDVLQTFDPLLDDLTLNWWPWPKAWLANTTRADALAKIGGTVGISAHHVLTLDDGDERFAAAHACCFRTGASLTVNYSPWHYFWNDRDSRGWDERAAKETEQAIAAFTKIRDLLREANGATSDTADNPVALSMVLLDQEILRNDLDENGDPDPFGAGPQPDQSVALRFKNDLMFRIAKDIFSDVTIAYHGQLSGGHHTAGELSDAIAETELYNLDSYTSTDRQMKELYRAALDDVINQNDLFNSRLSTDDIARVKFRPWLGIGGHYQFGYGHRRGFTGSQGIPEDAQPYEPGITWEVARHAMYPYFRNKPSSRAPWGKCDSFMIWPTRNTLKWWKNFICLIAGAHNLKEFENDWPQIRV